MMMSASIPVGTGRPELREGMAVALELLRMLADPRGAEKALRKIADAQAGLDEREKAMKARDEAALQKIADAQAALDAREKELAAHHLALRARIAAALR